MIILLETYVGCSDFRFEPSCTGRKVEEEELRERGIISDDILRRCERSSYISDWYDVNEGDTIRIIRWDDDGNIDETFVVPADLPDPPQRPDKSMDGGMHVYGYLAKHCKKVT